MRAHHVHKFCMRRRQHQVWHSLVHPYRSVPLSFMLQGSPPGAGSAAAWAQQRLCPCRCPCRAGRCHSCGWITAQGVPSGAPAPASFCHSRFCPACVQLTVFGDVVVRGSFEPGMLHLCLCTPGPGCFALCMQNTASRLESTSMPVRAPSPRCAPVLCVSCVT